MSFGLQTEGGMRETATCISAGETHSLRPHASSVLSLAAPAAATAAGSAATRLVCGFGVLRAAAADAGRCEAAVASATTASSSSKGPMALDGLPDDCLELVLQQLYTPSSSKSISAKANATEAGAASSSSST